MKTLLKTTSCSKVRKFISDCDTCLHGTVLFLRTAARVSVTRGIARVKWNLERVHHSPLRVFSTDFIETQMVLSAARVHRSTQTNGIARGPCRITSEENDIHSTTTPIRSQPIQRAPIERKFDETNDETCSSSPVVSSRSMFVIVTKFVSHPAIRVRWVKWSRPSVHRPRDPCRVIFSFKSTMWTSREHKPRRWTNWWGKRSTMVPHTRSLSPLEISRCRSLFNCIAVLLRPPRSNSTRSFWIP